MKKVVLSFICFLSACSSIFGYDKEFNNPIFNQPLEPLGQTSTWTYLTPTSIDIRTPLDKNLSAGKGKCDLIENKQDRITLKCDFSWYNPKGNPDIKQYYFTFLTKGYFFDTHIKIEELNYQIKDGKIDKISSEFYITPIDKTH